MIEITRATPDRLAVLCSLLGRAFVDEPMLQWSMAIRGDVTERLIKQFEAFNQTLVEGGMVWEAGDARGAAVWIPADAGDAYEEAFEASRAGIHALTDDGGRRWDAFWDWVESNIPDEPVWHLDAIGVEPEARGTGIGAALVQHGLERARADESAAFLETGTPGNVPLYEHFGFRVVEAADAPGGGPMIWFMRWDP
jgi:GNAT superfamily N-acetyltransferase